MTNHLEGHFTMDDINEICEYLSNKIVEAIKRPADHLNISNNEEEGQIVSVKLPS